MNNSAKLFRALKNLVECPDYKNINTLAMNNARDIVEAGEHRKVHVRDLDPIEQDIVVNMDDAADLKTIDNGKGVHVARILIWKGGKRQVAWFSIGCYRNKAILQITAGKKDRTETRKKVTCQPWLPGDKAIPEDAPEGV